jgi:rare lipoprotein A
MRHARGSWILAATVLSVAFGAGGCASTRALSPGPAATMGTASYYGRELAGRRTASGEVYHTSRLTAAHRTLPFGTRVRVTNLDNGRQVVVRINDRGPFRKGRIIDVSYAAARELGLIAPGTARVRLDVL